MRPPADADLRQPRILHECMPQWAHFKGEQSLSLPSGLGHCMGACRDDGDGLPRGLTHLASQVTTVAVRPDRHWAHTVVSPSVRRARPVRQRLSLGRRLPSESSSRREMAPAADEEVVQARHAPPAHSAAEVSGVARRHPSSGDKDAAGGTLTGWTVGDAGSRLVSSGSR
jgi:hypothetical protein